MLLFLHFEIIKVGVRSVKKKVSQDTIAQELHLSRNTVSKVLKNKAGIRESTRQQVLNKAAELHYAHPVVEAWQSHHASNCIEQLGYDIAFVCHDDSFQGSFWIPIVKAVERVLNNYACTMHFIVVTEENEKQLSISQSLLQKPPTGLIVVGLFSSAYYHKLAELNIPMVSYDIAPDLFEDQVCDVVMVENVYSTYTLTRRLIQKGLTNIAFAGNITSCQSFHERWEGYHRAMQEFPQTRKKEFTLNFPESSEYYLTEDFYKLLRNMSVTFEAFVCANDSVAYSAKSLLNPPYQLYDKLTLCGFDNTPEFASNIPHYSTVQILTDELGEALGEQILWRVRHPSYAYRMLRLGTIPVFYD